MKRVLSMLALVFAIFISSISFFGCDGPQQHQHSFVNGFCDCGEIKFGDLLTKESLSNVTITTDEDLTILRRQPVGEFPWFGNESGTSREYRTVKIANGLVEENYHITFIERVDDPALYVVPVVQEGTFKGTEMSVSTHDKERPQNQEQLSNFERHFDLITNVLTRGEFAFDSEKQAYVGKEYIFKMRNGCCDSVEAHEVIFKIENKRVTYLYFDIYVNSHDTVSTWNCAMKSSFIFSDYGTTIIE